MVFDYSKRLKRLPPYLFADIDRTKQMLRKKGVEFVDLSIGDPDIPAPTKVSNILYSATKLKENQKYALDAGKLSLRKAIKQWMYRRFKVKLDVNKEILPLIGSKEGLVHFPLGFVNPGEYVIIPSPGYPGYRGAAIFAGARIYELPLREKNKFLPQLEKIPLNVRNKAKLIYLNYPNNPTTSLATGEFLLELIRFCAKYGIIVAYDNAYSEIYFDKKPLSILELKGAKEVAIEFHSFSKTFCMTGFRIGWACGNENLIKGLLKVKTNIDSGIFGALQDVGEYVLLKEGEYIKRLRQQIKIRRDIFVDGLVDAGFKRIYAESTFYVWSKLPGGTSSIFFCKELLKRGVVATAGVGFGRYGEGFVRFALTVDIDKLKKALKLLKRIAVNG